MQSCLRGAAGDGTVRPALPLRGNQIFVRCASLGAFEETLTRALRRQKAPMVERHFLAVHEGAWALLLEETGADAGLSRLLSELSSARALLVELDGAALTLRVRDYQCGEPGQIREEPRFRDVEQIAWSLLEEAQVPAALRLFALAAVVLADGTSPGPGVPALELFVGPAGLRIEKRRAVLPERKPCGSPPAAPDLRVVSQAGESRAFELRTLASAPTASELKSLAEVEEAQALRLALQLAAEAEEERIARPGFIYQGFSVGKPKASAQGSLDEGALHRARSGRPWLARILDAQTPAPLGHLGFTALCAKALAREAPEARLLRAHALRLEVASATEGVSLCIPLLPGYLAYLRDAREEPELHAARAAQDARARLAAPPAGQLEPGPSRDTFLASLLPTLVPSDHAPVLATVPLTASLSSSLLIDDGRRIAPVWLESLAALGLSSGEALDRAIANADERTLQEPQALRYLELEEGRVLSCNFGDPGGAGRLLSPLLRSFLLQLFGGYCYVAVPTRDSLLACSADAPEALDWLSEEARRRFAEGPFPVHQGLLQLGTEGVRELAPDGF